MRKWHFWFLMCTLSLLHGAIFYIASRKAMAGGIAGVENQSALLLIPLLWVIAIFVIAAIDLLTLVGGSKMKRNRCVELLVLFQLSGVPSNTRIIRIASIAGICLLMVFGYWLFLAEAVLAAFYALSGGIWLVLLYAWTRESALCKFGQ